MLQQSGSDVMLLFYFFLSDAVSVCEIVGVDIEITYIIGDVGAIDFEI